MAAFDEILARVRACVESEGRVSYRLLKRRFELDDEDIEDIRSELIDAKRLARDEDDKVLVWHGADGDGHGAEAGETALVAPEGADRRLITVMFCDIVGSTELSARFDAEQLREIVQRYQETCGRVISARQGHVAQYLGDGLLVYFGYPVALEDEAGLAIRAALEILDALRRDEMLLERLGKPLQVRIGIHTGPVVIGEMGVAGRAERLALGETPNIAARVQSAARPDEILITAATLRLVDGLYRCEKHGPHELKGVSEPVELYTVRGESAAVNRFEVALSTGRLTRWVGREDELNLLARYWRDTTAGQGQVVFLSGEAGIGKSRLTQVFKERTGEASRHITLTCSPNHRRTAFYPVASLLRRMCEIDFDDDDDSESVAKLDRTLARYRFPGEFTAPLFASIMAFDHPGEEALAQLDGAARKRALFESLGGWILEEAAARTVLMTWDDIHWIDPATLEFVSWLIDHVPKAPVMLMLLFRSDYAPAWNTRGASHRLTLNGLAGAETDAMVAGIAGVEVPQAVLEFVRDKTDGVPLYVEELTHALIDDGVLERPDALERSARSGSAVPTTLRDSLEARLDSCRRGREIAQWAAVIGREFDLDLLEKVVGDNARVRAGVDELLDAELIYRSGTPGEPAFIFKHALLRDTAYESLLQRELRHRHALVADVLEEAFPMAATREPERLAYHLMQAGLDSRAVSKLHEAAQQAIEQGAEALAVQHLQLASELLGRVPPSAARNAHEVAVLLLLGPLLSSTLGAGAAEVREVYLRALEVCEELDDRRSRFTAYFGLRQYHLATGEIGKANDIASALYRAAQAAAAPDYLLEAHVALVTSHFFHGELAACRQHTTEALEIYAEERHARHAYIYGTEPGSLCRIRKAAVDLFQGHIDAAVSELTAACALVDRSGHLASRAFVHANAAEILVLLESYEQARAHIAVVAEVADGAGFPDWQAWSRVMPGRIAGLAGDTGGAAVVREGINAFDAATGELSLRRHILYPWFLLCEAEAHAGTGGYEAGLALMPEAISLLSRQRLKPMLAMAYRIRGDLLAQLSLGSEAEKSYRDSIALAGECEAPLVALFAAAGLGRLYTAQQRGAEADGILAAHLAALPAGTEHPLIARLRVRGS